MSLEKTEAYAKILKEYDLTSLKVEEEGLSIHLKREQHIFAADKGTPSQASSAPWESNQPHSSAMGGEDGAIDFNEVKEVHSPIVGVFYNAPSPGVEPFVAVGSRVKKGDVLCIIEAMKLMNEITAEFDGEIVDICLENGQVVEYGQTIFKLF